nr:hypothetical protein [Tanacetum cinerariifolium]
MQVSSVAKKRILYALSGLAAVLVLALVLFLWKRQQLLNYALGEVKTRVERKYRDADPGPRPLHGPQNRGDSRHEPGAHGRRQPPGCRRYPAHGPPPASRPKLALAVCGAAGRRARGAPRYHAGPQLRAAAQPSARSRFQQRARRGRFSAVCGALRQPAPPDFIEHAAPQLRGWRGARAAYGHRRLGGERAGRERHRRARRRRAEPATVWRKKLGASALRSPPLWGAGFVRYHSGAAHGQRLRGRRQNRGPAHGARLGGRSQF